MREFDQLCGLFVACRGQYGRFLFSCPEDNSRSSAGFAVGGGGASTFRVQRFWGPQSAGEYVVLDTSKPWKIYLNSVDDTSNWVPSNNGLSITRSSPPSPGDVITADFFFYYLCRFLEDLQDFEQFYRNLWDLRSLKFRSVKLSIPLDLLFPDPLPVFPTLRPGYSFKMKPTFSQVVQTSVDGTEVPVARQIFPIWDFEMTFEILRNQSDDPFPGFILMEDGSYILQEDASHIEMES